jgi:hypothetical protein
MSVDMHSIVVDWSVSTVQYRQPRSTVAKGRLSDNSCRRLAICTGSVTYSARLYRYRLMPYRQATVALRMSICPWKIIAAAVGRALLCVLAVNRMSISIVGHVHDYLF